jgi:predicted transposase YdaD
VLGILVLLRERDAPSYPTQVGPATALAIKVALDRVLPGWLAREPENPYVAALAPLVIADEPALRARAPALWQTVRTAAVSDEIRETLSEVLEYWLFERFRGLTAKEIWAMLNLLTPIEETRAYQSIFAEGEAKGKVEGKAEGKAEGLAEGLAEGEAKAKGSTLQRLLLRRFGPLPSWAEERIETASIMELDRWLDGVLDASSLEGLLGAGG